MQFEEDHVHNPQQAKAEEGIISHPFPFADDDLLNNVSDSKYEDQDDHEHDIDIESQEYPNRDPNSIPNQRLKWAQNLIEAIGNVAGDPYDRRRTRSQYHNEHVALSHTDPLLSERCFMMTGFDPQSYKEAFHDPIWKASMDDEFDSLQGNQTWNPISLPLERNLV